MAIFSVGHSTHADDTFAQIVRGVDVILDVRSHPTSKWPWWRQEQMQEWLPALGIGYEWEPRLGGWTAKHMHLARVYERHGVDVAAYARGAFPKQRIGVDRPDVPEDRPTWVNQGLHDYAWYTTTADFLAGLRALAERTDRVATLCAEAVYYKCHRSMVADALWAIYDIDTLHIKPFVPKRPTTTRWVRHTDVLGNRLDRYPESVREAWNLARATRAGT
jgi:uncharacterized protein (DUF488 family)